MQPTKGVSRPGRVLIVPAILLAALVSLPWLIALLPPRTATPYLREALSSAIILLLGGWIVTLIAREQRVARGHVEQLEALTLTDPLTGLGNRRAFERDVELRLRHAARIAEPVALIYMDVNGLKALNDDYGHASGDETLRILGGVLRSCSRLGSDGAYRVGGDEFVMIVSADRRGADVVAERVGRTFTERSPKSSRVSVGVVVWDGKASAGHLLDLADDRMYRQKQGLALQGARSR
jgi:diguanylate cyclase (GGDEF)-like protein